MANSITIYAFSHVMGVNQAWFPPRPRVHTSKWVRSNVNKIGRAGVVEQLKE